MTNVHACLVHESPECVADLVRNLRCLDPPSHVLLYDGSAGGRLLAEFRSTDDHVHVHPAPRPMRWGRLHGFAIDCLRFATDVLRCDAVTIVDSDQLLIRPGYSERLAEVLAALPRAGCLATAADPKPRAAVGGPAADARRERAAWEPFLRRFDGGGALFPHWTFWPGTVFTAAGVRAILALADDPDVVDLLARTAITATEEVVLPTLVALSGADVVPTPLGREVMAYRRAFRIEELERAARRDDAFWVHPVPRVVDDPLRVWVRERYGGYRFRSTAPATGEGPRAPLVSCLLPAGADVVGAAGAVAQFVRQTYPHRELVVVDGSGGAVEALVEDLRRVTYIPARAGMSRAAQRHLAAAHARGSVIAHWDPDTWSGPTRLADQVRALAATAADVCGLRSVLYYELAERSAWRYTYPADRRAWLADGSLCYLRDLRDRAPFPSTAPDWQAGFHWAGSAERVVVPDTPPSFVAALPPGCSPGAGDRWWEPVEAALVEGIVAWEQGRQSPAA